MIWILLQKYFSPNLRQHMSKKTQFSSCQKSSFIISVRAMTKLCREKWVSAVEKMTNYKVSHLLTFWQANANWNVKTSVNYLASLRSDEVFFFWNSWICLNSSYLTQCARMELNKRSLPKPMTTAGWKLIPHRSKITMN